MPWLAVTDTWSGMERFPRTKLRKAGVVLQTADVLSIFHDDVPKSDANAFSHLMRHLREFDGDHSTLAMVQVENETGLLGDSRGRSAVVEKQFAQPVPENLLHFLSSNWNSLHADLKGNLAHFKAQSKPRGPWVFGKGPHTDGLFMANRYAHYLHKVAAASNEDYPIPLYTNEWQNYVGSDGDNDIPILGGGDMSDISIRRRHQQCPRHLTTICAVSSLHVS
ncbi:putative beta-galactosidase [Aspergillus alliaceus]|uniref:putative beta-galactosidase n=1 Tax=Petromyces alliaceus TaxID=209559 RepID=UPI0012A3F8F4|nr:uncharacterized protein BDW43DRAFT_306911 [Aspergillus alliaceus]KAB8238226.1 hypothetical protein BDW43DRAFT_306911 [Aspergillus alliaceus]